MIDNTYTNNSKEILFQNSYSMGSSAPGIYLENGLDGPMAHQVQKTWAGGMGAA